MKFHPSVRILEPEDRSQLPNNATCEAHIVRPVALNVGVVVMLSEPEARDYPTDDQVDSYFVSLMSATWPRKRQAASPLPGMGNSPQ